MTARRRKQKKDGITPKRRDVVRRNREARRAALVGTAPWPFRAL